MSAFVVDKAHIDAMVQAGLNASPYGPLTWRHEDERHELTRETANRVGAMLLAENVRSVEYRYSPPGRETIYGEGWETPDQDLPGRYVSASLPGFDIEVRAPEYLIPYSFTPCIHKHWKPVAILKAIDCFEYQSCETDDWEQSEAFAFCDALRRSMVHRLAGYDDEPWGIS